MAAVLMTSGLAMALGGGVASAQTASETTTGFSLWDNQTPSLIQQNTKGYGYNNDPISGAGATWVFRISGNWKEGDTYSINVQPNTYPFNVGGGNCGTPLIPPGVNQSTIDFANYVGFHNVANVSDGPILYQSSYTSGEAPQVTFAMDDSIGCSNFTGTTSYATLNIILTNSGNGQAGQTAEIIIGRSFDEGTGDWEDGPVLFDVGYGATTGPAHFTGHFCPAQNGNPVTCKKTGNTDPDDQWVNATQTFDVASSVTVTGQRPSANNPRTTLVRDTRTDWVAGPISEFKISEDVVNALPPTDGYTPEGLPVPVDENNNEIPAPDANRHLITTGGGDPQGAVCLKIDHSAGSNDIYFGDTLPTWGVDPGASVTPNSARPGPGQVVEEQDDLLRLPVRDSSNATPTVWTTTGLNVEGTAYADGPVYAWVYYVYNTDFGNSENTSCLDAWNIATQQYAGQGSSENKPYLTTQLGYVQLATVSEVASSIAGATAVDTAAEAIEHQYDYAKGDCVGELYFDDEDQGGAIFLARDDFYADGLGAAYSAGTVDTGVLLTNPTKLSSAAKQAIRRQGVQTVYIAGGPLAISDAVEAELAGTTAYLCGGNQPRLDPNTGKPKKLVVERIAGETLYDTNELLAEFAGAQMPMAFGAFGIWSSSTPDLFNNTDARSLVGTAPTRPVNTALLVTGENFQDAMVGSVPAYGGDYWCAWCGEFGQPMPLIATPSNSLSPQAIDAMRNQSIQQLIVLGGPLAVSESVVDEAVAAIPGLGVVRIAGQTASDTSVQLAEFELSASLGMGWQNTDFDWGSYVNRSAGDINQNQCYTIKVDEVDAQDRSDYCITARTVLMARGDWFADAMAAAPVLSVHNGRWDNVQKFPLITTDSPSSLGVPVITFLVRGSFWISTLDGGTYAGGLGVDYTYNGLPDPIYCVGGSYVVPGCNVTTESSNVYTIQPIGGTLALTPALLEAAGKWIGFNGGADLGS